MQKSTGRMGHVVYDQHNIAPCKSLSFPTHKGKKVPGEDSLDLSVFLVGKFLAHDMVDTDHVINHKIKHRIFRGYMHPPPRSSGFQFFNIPRSMGVFLKPVDMFPDNTTIFFGQVPDESPGIIPDCYLHGIPALKTEFFLGLVPGNEVCILVNFVKIAFKSS